MSVWRALLVWGRGRPGWWERANTQMGGMQFKNSWDVQGRNAPAVAVMISPLEVRRGRGTMGRPVSEQSSRTTNVLFEISDLGQNIFFNHSRTKTNAPNKTAEQNCIHYTAPNQNTPTTNQKPGSAQHFGWMYTCIPMYSLPSETSKSAPALY